MQDMSVQSHALADRTCNRRLITYDGRIMNVVQQSLVLWCNFFPPLGGVSTAECEGALESHTRNILMKPMHGAESCNTVEE